MNYGEENRRPAQQAGTGVVQRYSAEDGYGFIKSGTAPANGAPQLRQGDSARPLYGFNPFRRDGKKSRLDGNEASCSIRGPRRHPCAGGGADNPCRRGPRMRLCARGLGDGGRQRPVGQRARPRDSAPHLVRRGPRMNLWPGGMAADVPRCPSARSAVRCNASLFRNLAQLPQRLR
jgi:hypothetical protein